MARALFIFSRVLYLRLCFCCCYRWWLKYYVYVAVSACTHVSVLCLRKMDENVISFRELTDIRRYRFFSPIHSCSALSNRYTDAPTSLARRAISLFHCFGAVFCFYLRESKLLISIFERTHGLLFFIRTECCGCPFREHYWVRGERSTARFSPESN